MTIGITPLAYAKQASSGKQSTILIAPQSGVSEDTLKSAAQQQGVTVMYKAKRLGVYKARIASDKAADAISALTQSGLVKYAEPDYRRKAAAAPNDSYYSDQWGLRTIGVEDAWSRISANSTPTVIALLDTGIDINHEDLVNQLMRDPAGTGQILGRHFYTDISGRQVSDGEVSDNAGHGTHIAGIIGAQMNNSRGVAGIAVNARLMPVKVLDDVGYGDDSNIAEGLMWAVDQGARIINMSLAGPQKSRTLANAVKYARDKGAVIVAATGNEGLNIPNYPAAYPGVIGVGASDSSDNWMVQSNFGTDVDVVAPGVSILSTYPPALSDDNTSYEVHSGTSMAAGFVSGLAALILANNPSLTAEQVQGIIFATADDRGVVGWDGQFGHGRINASRALSAVLDSMKPTVTITSPASLTQVKDEAILVTAAAGDEGSGLGFVDFLLNGERVGSAINPPYQVTITPQQLQGINTVSAVAYDKSGNTTTSEITLYKQTFNDVAPTHWAFQDIETLTSSKVLSGYPGGTFKPGEFVDRAEFVKMLVEGLGLTKKTSYSGYFKDVPRTYWAWPYIEAAYDMGLINGYSKDKFAPRNNIKRVEMATILIKTGSFVVDYSGTPFNDVSMTYWGYVYVMSARNAGVITGYPGNQFRPENVMTRAEAARSINRSNLIE